MTDKVIFKLVRVYKLAGLKMALAKKSKGD